MVAYDWLWPNLVGSTKYHAPQQLFYKYEVVELIEAGIDAFSYLSSLYVSVGVRDL